MLMFRQRPLMCLFILATLFFDVAYVATLDAMPPVLVFGLLFGQLAAMTIWMIRGQMFRLTRATCLLLALYGHVFLFRKSHDFGETITLSFFYVSVLLVFTAVSDSIKRRVSNRAKIEVIKTKWQISLIECFGWTIVASVVSYGARFMDFKEFFQEDSVFLFMFIFLTVPVCVALFSRRNIKGISIGGALGILAIAIFTFFLISKYVHSVFIYLVLGQTLYLMSWLVILSLDKPLTAPEKNRPAEKADPPADVPESFDLKV